MPGKESKQDEGAAMSRAEEIRDKVNSAVGSNDYVTAIKAVVGPIVRTKSDEVKKIIADAGARALAAVPDAQIDKTINGMDQTERDNCLKFVFKAMATGENCSSLLKWHEKLVAKDGKGIIMRSLVDRRV